MHKTRPSVVCLLSIGLGLLGTAIVIEAAPPDLTAGGVPGDSVTMNLGATGIRGWVYHVNTNTSESRQILVTSVDTSLGSPANGVLQVNDVILGADGSGGSPVNFNTDARRSIASAIAAAEARTPAALQLLRWRGGVTTTVGITLETLGAYTSTAPYHCPKSANILAKGMEYCYHNESAGRYRFGALALLAANNLSAPSNTAGQFLDKAELDALALIPTAQVMAQMMSDQRDTSSTWERGHALIFLAEYYLVTGDTRVLPAIEAYAVNVAKNSSLFGTVGHIYAEKNLDGSNNGPMGGVYGVVNSAGMPCFLGLLLAQKCGLTNPELTPAIERASRFFAYYSGKGAPPYGEHEAYWQGHENNGKSGLAALSFMLQSNRVAETKFFAKMSTASSTEREVGHTGPFFNYLWAPLGAAAGGEEAAAGFFNRIRWMLDLNRRWDGSFSYDALHEGSGASGGQYNDFRMSTAALLIYALPLRQLHLTGLGHDPARYLSSSDVAEAITADDYKATTRTVNELVADLGMWSPKVQRLAATEFSTRTVNAATIAEITALANDPLGSSRVGACLALGRINDSASAAARAATLAALLTDPNKHVRYMAAEAMRYLPTTAKTGELNTIMSAAATTGSPLLPYDEEDPLHFAHGRIATLLFYSGNAYGPKGIIYNNLTGVNRSLLYPAIRAVAANPIGFSRSTLATTYGNLSLTDVRSVADAIVDSVQLRAPADKMFSGGVRQAGIQILQKFGIAEGVPLSQIYMVNDTRGSTYDSALGVLEDYAGGCTTVLPDPDVVGFCQSLLGGGQASAAQAVLDAIAADPTPVPLTPLKSIQSITAGAPSLTLPANSTTLQVSANDLALGDSVYTWRKVYGVGNVTFTPNGTAESDVTSITFDNLPGVNLFEVTMSDSRGLTEVRDTVFVTLYDTDGTLPLDTNPPSTPGFEVPPTNLTSSEITMTATTVFDPEGTAVQYRFHNTTLDTYSAWQSGTTFIATGLAPDTNYFFTVQSRDAAAALNESAPSAALSAMTFSATTIHGRWNVDADGNWSDAANWLDSLIANDANSNVYLANVIMADRTITLDSARTIGNIIAQDTDRNYTISGANVLTLEVNIGKPIIDVIGSRTLTISSVVAGNDGLQKNGAGTLVLNATNTFTGNTTVSGGMLSIGGNATAGSTLGNAGTYAGDVSIASGAKLVFNTATTQTLGGVISGGGALQKGGSGTLTLSDHNTYTGKTTIAAAGAGGPTLSVSSFNSVDIEGGDPNLPLPGSSLGRPTTLADGTIDLGSGTNIRNCALIYTGPGEITDRVMHVSFNSGSDHTINASGSGLLKFTSPFDITKSSGSSTSSLTLRGAGNGEIADGMTGEVFPGFLQKSDAGTWTLGGTTRVNEVIMAGGNLIVSGSLTSATTITASSGTLTVNGSLSSPATTLSGGIVNGSGSLVFKINGSSNDRFTMTSGTLNATGLSIAIDPIVFGLTESEYVLIHVNGGTRTGTFSSLTGAKGYSLNYDTPGQVKLVAGVVNPYITWAGAAAFADDANGDGMDNGLAFLLGADNPNDRALGLLPTVTENTGGLVLTFQMLASAARGDASVHLEFGNTLAPGSWTTLAVPDMSSTVDGVVFTITGTGPLNVTATIPASKAASGKLFGRLKGTQ